MSGSLIPASEEGSFLLDATAKNNSCGVCGHGLYRWHHQLGSVRPVTLAVDASQAIRVNEEIEPRPSFASAQRLRGVEGLSQAR